MGLISQMLERGGEGATEEERTTNNKRRGGYLIPFQIYKRQ